MLANHRYARLACKTDRMRWGRRLFGQGTDHEGYEIIDLRDSFAQMLIRDGSIVLEKPPAVVAAAAAAETAGEPPSHGS